MSDQYVKLEEERRQKERAEKKKKEKKKRKEKRSQRGKKHDSGPESEEDITPAHMVDIVTEEMPEVCLSFVSCLCVGCLMFTSLSHCFRMPYPVMMMTETPMTLTKPWTLTWTSESAECSVTLCSQLVI